MGSSVPAQYFIDLYRRQTDPWHFETNEYERAKYAATLNALPRSRYADALEIACSVGVFTNMLAERCDALLALDVSADALDRARRNCAAHSYVRLERCIVPHEYPQQTFDLTTICEMGYYLDERDLLALRAQVVAHSLPGAHVILVHWTPAVDGHASTAAQVHGAFLAAPELRPLHGFSEPTYRLDVLEKRPTSQVC